MDAASAFSVLDWWHSAGVDMLVDEEPRNWLAEPRGAAVAAAPAEARPATGALPNNLSAFRAWLEASETLPDGSEPGRRIFPEGDPAAGLMILIDMPEAADSGAARLLSDETGRLLEAMLAAIGRDRGSVYLASLMLARPPGGRIEAARLSTIGALAKHHVALAAPKRLLLMGQAASRAVLGTELVAARAKLHAVNHGGATVEAIATFAPRFLIQNPSRKADSWKDLRMLIEGLDI